MVALFFFLIKKQMVDHFINKNLVDEYYLDLHHRTIDCVSLESGIALVKLSKWKQKAQDD